MIKKETEFDFLKAYLETNGEYSIHFEPTGHVVFVLDEIVNASGYCRCIDVTPKAAFSLLGSCFLTPTCKD